MTISAKIVLDSISPAGIRLTTLELEYPRFIHSEFMTHRVFSRNASSSRAIPFKKLRRLLLDNPACPIHWGANRPGMQAHSELTGWRLKLAKGAWHAGKYLAVGAASFLNWAGAHKQIVNRVIEPWSHIRVIVTATDWANFMALRDHQDAQPEIRELARQIKFVMDGSRPTLLKPGQWHLPYITDADRDARLRSSTTEDEFWAVLRRVSAARCARVSYLTHDGRVPDIKEDLELFERLAGTFPIHASPMEHQATPDVLRNPAVNDNWAHPEQHGNLFGWRSHRRMLPGNTVQDKRAA